MDKNKIHCHLHRCKHYLFIYHMYSYRYINTTICTLSSCFIFTPIHIPVNGIHGVYKKDIFWHQIFEIWCKVFLDQIFAPNLQSTISRLGTCKSTFFLQKCYSIYHPSRPELHLLNKKFIIHASISNNIIYF
jgi:hypothetical protein